MGTLLVFLIIFLPMGWLIWHMIRFTRDTIGTNSPMKVQRIYRTTIQSFFVRSDYLFVLMGLIMFIVTMHAVFFARFSTPYPEIGRAVVFLLSLSSLALPAMIVSVDLNHWPYSRGVVITSYPEAHQLEIELPDAVLVLKEGDISRIEILHNNGKLQLGFAVFYLTSGDHFILPFKTEGMWVIQEYFKGLTVEYFDRLVPLIRVRSKRAAVA
nr:hypothetical protein [uncultured Dyadobacter sp.]